MPGRKLLKWAHLAGRQWGLIKYLRVNKFLSYLLFDLGQLLNLVEKQLAYNLKLMYAAQCMCVGRGGRGSLI